ncbi:BACH hydrolase, partial [Atractosteus spatula]|nr:BACH hydrolase [Atractosteus spatula]
MSCCTLSLSHRIMRPDDANIVGNVHGGTILKMIEEAGGIISTRHCNTQPGERSVAALARVERTDFLHPMFIGEVAHVSAEITYTSKHSVEVQVMVMAENILTGASVCPPSVRQSCQSRNMICTAERNMASVEHCWSVDRMQSGQISSPGPKPCNSSSGGGCVSESQSSSPEEAEGVKKVTNKATLWYVPFSLQNVDKIIEVPPIEYTSQEEEEEGKKRYEAQKMERMETKERNGDIITPVTSPDRQTKDAYTVGFSQSSLIHLVGPSDCTLHGFVHGGVTMKLMDEVAGIVAARHCKTNIVTASVDAINFHRKIKKGCVVTVSGRMTFASNKSMEIEVFVDADPIVEDAKGKYRAVSAFFTFISLDKEGKPLPVPPLKLETEEEKKRFEEGKVRYLQNKAKRQVEKKCQQ